MRCTTLPIISDSDSTLKASIGEPMPSQSVATLMFRKANLGPNWFFKATAHAGSPCATQFRTLCSTTRARFSQSLHTGIKSLRAAFLAATDPPSDEAATLSPDPPADKAEKAPPDPPADKADEAATLFPDPPADQVDEAVTPFPTYGNWLNTDGEEPVAPPS